MKRYLLLLSVILILASVVPVIAQTTDVEIHPYGQFWKHRASAIEYNGGSLKTYLDGFLPPDLSNYYKKTETYSTSEVNTLLLNKADAASVYTIIATDLLLLDKADTGSVYTKTITDLLLLDKADTGSVYTKAVSDGKYALKTTVDSHEIILDKVNPAVSPSDTTFFGWKTATGFGYYAVSAITTLAASAITITASSISEATHAQGWIDSMEANILSSSIYGFEETGKPSLTYDSATRTVTITGNHYIWCNGKRYSKTTASIQHTMVSGGHYIYYDATGTLTVSTTAWDILTTAQVAYVYYNAVKVSTPVGVLYDERHGRIMTSASHLYNHMTRGAQSSDTFALSAYSLQPASPSNAGNQFAVAGGTIRDEDIALTIAGHPDGAAPTIMWREGATGVWTWNTNPVVPALTGTTYAKYNQFTAGTWGTTEVASGDYITYYAIVTNATDATYSIILIPGQTNYANLGLAQAEGFTSLNLGTLPINEFIPVAKLIYRCQSTYSSATGRFRIEQVDLLFGTRVNAGVASVANHGSLAGRSDPGSHPDTAITMTHSKASGLTNPDLQTWANSVEVALTAASAGGGKATEDTATYVSANTYDFTATYDTTAVVIYRNGQMTPRRLLRTSTVSSKTRVEFLTATDASDEIILYSAK